VAAVAGGEWASDVAVRVPSFGVTSLRDFGVIRGPSLDHSIRPPQLQRRCKLAL